MFIPGVFGINLLAEWEKLTGDEVLYKNDIALLLQYINGYCTLLTVILTKQDSFKESLQTNYLKIWA